MDKKLSTLADLFRPPIELMHKGSFETVRKLLLNTLYHSSFLCGFWTFTEISDCNWKKWRWYSQAVILNQRINMHDQFLVKVWIWVHSSIVICYINHYGLCFSVPIQAKDCGQLENKWLMINIQNVQDFACQCLNRDVWSNDAVKTIIREHFIFWQVHYFN